MIITACMKDLKTTYRSHNQVQKCTGIAQHKKKCAKFFNVNMSRLDLMLLVYSGMLDCCQCMPYL